MAGNEGDQCLECGKGKYVRIQGDEMGQHRGKAYLKCDVGRCQSFGRYETPPPETAREAPTPGANATILSEVIQLRAEMHAQWTLLTELATIIRVAQDPANDAHPHSRMTGDEHAARAPATQKRRRPPSEDSAKRAKSTRTED